MVLCEQFLLDAAVLIFVFPVLDTVRKRQVETGSSHGFARRYAAAILKYQALQAVSLLTQC